MDTFLVGGYRGGKAVSLGVAGQVVQQPLGDVGFVAQAFP